ncbi:hypothetical protein SUZIE_132830 [Sciurus carolinensis]|uniref:Uncharacterized protein n=1 Tax=Sciurus carolinensis TaxID=30640 RepID=A0AA41SWS8_SCICA|nr:hypothetical protein [Sciurus carolinensis]
MFSALIIFIVDLMLALAIIVTFYAVYLITATGIFVLFYLFKGEMEKNYDFNKGRMWMPDSSKATGKTLPSNLENVGPRVLPARFPAEREGSFLPKEKQSFF